MANVKMFSSKGKKAAKRGSAASSAASRGAQASSTANRGAQGTSAASRGTQTSSATSRVAQANGAVNRGTQANGAANRSAAAYGSVNRGAPANKAVKRGTAGKTVAIIGAILVVGIIALFISLGYYVRSLDTVYPNVWADGVSMSGMTLSEASKTLTDMGYESNAEGVSATIVFPDDSSFTVYGEEAGFALNSEEAALAAFEIGRGGSFLENELAYIRAHLSKTDLRDVSASKFNEEYVREAAIAHTKAYNDMLMADSYTISRYSIIIEKGISFAPADEDAVIELAVSTLLQAMAEKKQLTAYYDPEYSVEKVIDLDMLFDTIYVEAISSVYDPETFSATKSYKGTTFDIAEARAMMDAAGMGEHVIIPLITVEPDVVEDDINSLLFRDILAEQTTYIGGNSNRLNNVTLSSGAVNGTKLNPGDVFSFNETVGQRTVARGYMEAGAYAGNLLVTEIGGGICQSSSTIYACVLKTDLEVVERRPHGMIVGYLPLGSDATVNWGSIDFKFKNNTEYPIRIDVTIDGRDLTVQLIGTKLDDNYYKIEHTVVSSTPVEVIMREDEEIPQGTTKVLSEGSTGYVVDVYKHLYDVDGNLISTTLVGRSAYQVQHRIILTPPELPEDPDADVEDPDADVDDPDAVPGDPDVVPGDPDALPGGPDTNVGDVGDGGGTVDNPGDGDTNAERPNANPEDPGVGMDGPALQPGDTGDTSNPGDADAGAAAQEGPGDGVAPPEAEPVGLPADETAPAVG